MPFPMNIKRIDIVNIFYSVFHYLPSCHYAGFTLNINPPPSIPTSKCCRCCQRTSQCHSGHCDIDHAQITIAEYRIVLSSPNAIIQCFAHTNHALEYGLKYTLYSFSRHSAICSFSLQQQTLFENRAHYRIGMTCRYFSDRVCATTVTFLRSVHTDSIPLQKSTE